ncbi:ATP-dependent RNA helicase [Aureococcus anophagefferens]|nr:ATP-dependent RNA helicase [Aureococcus anophagefferens]
MSEADADKLRRKWCILVDGDDVPAPIKSFAGMGLERDLLDALGEKRITTPIQVQGMPAAGRDMIGIAFTGSGKTVAFSVPLIVRALEAERRSPLRAGEGPVGLVLCPSRSSRARPGRSSTSSWRACAAPAGGGATCCGPRAASAASPKGPQLDDLRRRGVHAVVATPGRLKDFLESRQVRLGRCSYFCLDEGDRMLDLGFDEEVHKVMNHFEAQRQTLLFSATMPQKFQDFARGALVRSVLVNVSRAGAANLDVIQEVEYVKLEARIVYLLECLQKTAPPVVIFCERKGDVDDIHEYLLLKGVEAVSIHGGKDQGERNGAIDAFKRGAKDVLVATDVAAKGLDFPDIQHVINFDMPAEIENYVHRIGRTGRCGKTGVATTFINKTVEPSSLLDLKHLLVEAKQRVPPVLQVLDEPDANRLAGDAKGCAFCGGLGHRITDCPKRDKDARRLNANRRDMIAGSGGAGGDW